jgi:fumarylacetoacetase
MYWLLVQQLVHHSVAGCPVRAGDQLASGMILGMDPRSFGSMLELSWGGTRNVELNGGIRRRFLKNGDTVIM